MPYQISTTTSFIIDGDETNAGQRVFARHVPTFVIDGLEAGTAANRAFLRVTKFFVIDGGLNAQPDPYVTQASQFMIDGKPVGGHVNFQYDSAFSVEARAGGNTYVGTRAFSTFTIEDVAQEPTP